MAIKNGVADVPDVRWILRMFSGATANRRPKGIGGLVGQKIGLRYRRQLVEREAGPQLVFTDPKLRHAGTPERALPHGAFERADKQ